MSTDALTLPFADEPTRLRHYLRLLRRGFPDEKAQEIAGGLFGGISGGVIPDRAFPHTADGFGGDDAGRRFCYANARAAGIDTAGKVYVPGFARPGLSGGRDPQAWIEGNRSEIKRFCDENGCTSEGRVEYEGKPLPEPEPQPYQVAEKYVTEEVNRRCEQEDTRPSPQKRAQMADEARERLSGR